MPGESTIDDLISICWKRVRGSSNFIFLSQIRPIIHEMQLILRVDSIFTDTENKLIEQFIQSDPMRKLQKQEFRVFLNRSVQYGNLLVLLLNRFKITTSEIELRVKHFDDVVPNGELLSPADSLSSRPSTSGKEYKYKVLDELKRKDEYIREKTQDLNSKEMKYSRLLSQFDEQVLVNKTLENENVVLKNYVKELEAQLARKPEDKSSRTLLTKLKDRDLTIKDLDQIGKEYRKRITQLEQREMETNIAVKKLEQSLLEQDKLVETLKDKLISQTNESSAPTLKGFIATMPIIKQWIMFLKYKQDIKSNRMFVLNMITLVLTAWLFGLMLQLVYRSGVILFYATSSSNIPRTYVYDNYGRSRIWGRLGFDFWRRLPWLEQIVYRFIDW
ncbi:hypothetical protein Cantr_05423 [Candida viswanathii]|uniref:Uncharacterized protein n=1 Tax=Candida viswanathii TaxID=5486 RepID=A0A367XQU4_9ASCO|nr:hypothetical protein Cantr_05423 [Candida viswanathii]